MGLLDSLFGKKREPASAHNSAGPVVLVARAPETLRRGLEVKRRPVLAFVHDEPELADRIAGCAPACVVLEVESTKTSGFSIANVLKRDGRLQSVPLVLFSSETDAETFEQHKKLRTRADAYVTSGDPDRIREATLPFISSSPVG